MQLFSATTCSNLQQKTHLSMLANTKTGEKHSERQTTMNKTKTADSHTVAQQNEPIKNAGVIGHTQPNCTEKTKQKNQEKTRKKINTLVLT